MLSLLFPTLESWTPMGRKTAKWRSTVLTASQVSTSKAVAADEAASVVAILKWPDQCHNLAKKLGGDFSSMEELESKALLKHAEAIGLASSGCDVAAVLIRIARECITRLPGTVKTMQTNLEADRLPRVTASTTNVPVVRAFLEIAESPTPANLFVAAETIEAIPGVFVHRSELWRAIKRSIAVQRDEKLDTTLEAAVIVRDRTRENGRAAQQRTVSRTLLVKGLEYDHAMILNAGLLDNAQDFYVAATRGRLTLNVLSEKRVLRFPQPDL